MRSLLITFDYPPAVGGIARVLAHFWRLAGHDGCAILAPAGAGALDFDRDHLVRTVRFPAIAGLGALGKALTFGAGLLWASAQLARQRPDLVVAGQLVRAGPLAWAWHRLTGRPYDLWVYGGETSPGFAPRPWMAAPLRAILCHARTVFTNSPFTTAEMLGAGLRRAQVVELPLAVDTETFSPQPPDPALVQRLGLSGKLVFLTVGRLVERKGVDAMLRCLASLGSQLPPWHYLVLSDGPYRPVLEGLVDELALRHRVTFTGFVDQGELPRYYRLGDVFAMPNREVVGPAGGGLSVEGFGIVFLEAAACGKPVIAGRSGGAVHALEDGVTGFLVDPADPASLRAAVLALADPERRQAMGAAGLEFARRFSWERSAAILRRYL
ncbi:MAG: glycosyltransferase [Gemmatimonadota bacterium]